MQTLSFSDANSPERPFSNAGSLNSGEIGTGVGFTLEPGQNPFAPYKPRCDKSKG
jgi:hypothetical protein